LLLFRCNLYAIQRHATDTVSSGIGQAYIIARHNIFFKGEHCVQAFISKCM
jgi:hypothetical protein